MAAGVFALVGAAVVAVAYVVLSERFDYSTVSRRQIDVWAALTAFACLGVILYGGLEAQRELRRHPRQALPAPLTRQVVHRLHQPDLRLVAAGGSVAEADSASADAAVSAVSGMSFPSDPPGDWRRSDEPARDRSSDDEDNVVEATATARTDAALPTAQTAPFVVPTQIGEPGPGPSPTATAMPIPIVTDRPPPLVTLTPHPTSDPPTPEPTSIASATPHCGDPEDIRLRIERLDTELGRRTGSLEVSYRARIRNESDFPATMADVVVTALNHSAGSDHFGHASRPDITLAPGAVITIEGALTLTKSPPPFGSTDLCLSFVGETCGRRPPYRVVRQCSTVRGF